MNRSGMMGAFQEVCFEIPVSTSAKPDWRTIKTKHGYQYVALFHTSFGIKFSLLGNGNSTSSSSMKVGLMEFCSLVIVEDRKI